MHRVTVAQLYRYSPWQLSLLRPVVCRLRSFSATEYRLELGISIRWTGAAYWTLEWTTGVDYWTDLCKTAPIITRGGWRH